MLSRNELGHYACFFICCDKCMVAVGFVVALYMKGHAVVGYLIKMYFMTSNR